MKCVGLLALLISIQWASKFIDLHHHEAAVEESSQEFENNGNVDDEAHNNEENDYVEGKDINENIEPQDVDINHTDDTEHVDASETLSTTQPYVADDVHTSSESILESTDDEPYFFINLEDLLNQSSSVLADISNPTVTSIASIESSLRIISTASFDMLPKVADQITLIYEGLSSVAGPDIFMLNVLIESLSSIFDTITSASKVLEPGIGAEASDSLNNLIYKVQVNLKSLLHLINGSADESLLTVTKEIGKSVQYVASSLTSIALTVFGAIGDVNKLVVESAISLQLVFSAVLYVTQWVLAVGVSIFHSLVGSVNEMLTKLTIAISKTIRIVSRICSVISMIQSESLESVSVKAIPLIQELKQLLTSTYAPISGHVYNIVFNIDKILADTPKETEKPIAELNQDTKGTILEILSMLTGKLVPISPDLSSALFSLNNSLRIGSNFGSSALTVISNILTLVLSRYSSLNGTSSEILSLISNLLDGTFTNLSDVVAKFSILGNVIESLKSAVSNIQKALRSLIDSVIAFSADWGLVDPIKNVAKSSQILISSFAAIFEAVSQASKDISQKLSEVVSYLPYIVSTLLVIVQYVLGASIAQVLVTIKSVPIKLQDLALATSTILQRITSITASVTLAQSGTDTDYYEIVRNYVSPVSELNMFASTSLSSISQVLANIKVSLDTRSVKT